MFSLLTFFVSSDSEETLYGTSPPNSTSNLKNITPKNLPQLSGISQLAVKILTHLVRLEAHLLPEIFKNAGNEEERQRLRTEEVSYIHLR